MSGHPVLFLSHASADAQTARELKRRILASPDALAVGLEVWFDKDDLVPGRDWQDQLEQVITAKSTAFAVVVGTRGVVNWVDREVRAALARATRDKTYPFIPVFLNASEMSLSLQDVSTSLPPFARQFQGVWDPLGNETELGKLLRAALGLDQDRDGVGRRHPVRLASTPFVGLRAMTETDADLFFGREEELDALVETLRANRLVAIVADSGSGKSSLAQAGLIPRIRGGALEDTSREAPDGRAWHVVAMRPGGDPVEGLRRGVTAAAERLRLDGDARASLRRRIDPAQTGPAARAEWVYALQCDLPAGTTETVLIVDQFEELLTQTPPARRQPFIDWLMEITHDAAAIPVRAVLTIRADYFNLCSAFAAFYERIKPDRFGYPKSGAASARRSALFHLKALTAAAGNGAGSQRAGLSAGQVYVGLAAIVHRPLIVAGHQDEAERDALQAAIRQDVSDRPGDLVLVQMALFETWRESKSGQENLVEVYSRVGGVAGALAHVAEEVRTEKLSEDEAALLEATLVRLVNLGETGGATRRAARRSEFDPTRCALAEKLTTGPYGRLLLAGSDTFEICHEQLITQWPWWQNCLSASGADVRVLAQLILKTASWLSGGKARRYLVTGAELGLFKGLAHKRAPWLSEMELAFVRAARRWTNIGRVAATAAVLALVMASGGMTYLWLVADQAKNQANESAEAADKAMNEAVAARNNAVDAKNEAIANESRALAALSDSAVRTSNPNDALKLALAAWPRSASDPRPRLLRTAQAVSQATAKPLTLLPDIKHDGPVNGATFDRMERRILSWSHDGTVRLWEAATGRSLGAPMNHGNAVQGAVFDKTEGRILSWSDDGSIRIWDVATGQPRGAPMRHDARVYGALFDVAEDSVLSWSEDKTLRLWNAATGQPRGTPIKHDGPVHGALFDEAGGRILSWSVDGTVRLWDAVTGKPLGAPMENDGGVQGARFDASEGRILAWGDAISVWDAASGRLIVPPMKHSGDTFLGKLDKAALYGARFNRTDDVILSWSFDGTARLWNAATGKPLGTPMSHNEPVRGAIFDRSEGRILTRSESGILRLWDVVTQKPLGAPMQHDGPISGARFDEAGSRILSWSADGTIRLWDVATGNSLGLPMKCDRFSADSALFDKSEGLILTRSANNICLLDTATGRVSGPSMRHDGVNGACFDEAGTRILSWSDDGTIRVWDAVTRKPLGLQIKHNGKVFGARFDRSEDHILSWSEDKTVRLWDVATGLPVGVPMQHDWEVYGAIFDKAEGRILSWSRDGIVRLWDATTGKQIGVPMSHGGTGVVGGALFDDAESRILSWSTGGTVHIWDVATGKPLGATMKHSYLVKALLYKAGNRVLSWGTDGNIRVWDGATGSALGAPMKHDHAVNGAILDKAEGRILSWSSDRTVRVWDEATGKPVTKPMKHGDGAVRGARFTQSENRILSWSDGGTMRLWDTATGQPLGAPMKHGHHWVKGANFDKSETRVLSWSADGTIRLWDVSRLMHGNLVEVACSLLADKDVSTLERDFGIKVTDPICTNDGRDAPAPDINSLRE